MKTAYNDVIDVVDVDIMVSITSKIDVFLRPSKKGPKTAFLGFLMWGLLVWVIWWCWWCDNDEFNVMMRLAIMMCNNQDVWEVTISWVYREPVKVMILAIFNDTKI